MWFNLTKGNDMKKMITIFAVATFASTAVMANEMQNKWYGGVGLGQSNLSFNSEDFRVNPAISDAGYTASTYDRSEDTSYSLYGGYRFNKNFSAKVEYANFGTQKWGYNITDGNANSNVNIKALSVAAVGEYPVAEKVSVLGELGAYYYDAKRSPTHSGTVVPLTGTPEGSSDNGIKPFVSVGLQYDVTNQVSVIGKYAYYGKIGNQESVGRVKLNNVSVNLQYNF